MIPNIDELLIRFSQEETRMMETDHPSNGNRGDPTAFFAHAKNKNHGGPRNQKHGRVGPKRRKGRCSTCNKSGQRVPQYKGHSQG